MIHHLPGAAKEQHGLLRAHRGKLIAAALLGVLALAAATVPSVEDLVARFAYGQGYVPWNELEWKARQTASAGKKPLLIWRQDPRHPVADRRLLEVLREDAVQPHLQRVVWLKVVEPSAEGEEPRPPSVRIVGSNSETPLVERDPAHELDAAGLIALIEEAVARNAKDADVR